MIDKKYTDLYLQAKKKHSYESLKIYIYENDQENMLDICNLYFSFIIYSYKFFHDYELFLERFLNKNILRFKKLNAKYYNEPCYICRGHEYNNEYIIECENSHYVHLLCFYQKIIQYAHKNSKCFTFDIHKECIYCDYCKVHLIKL